MHQVTIATRRRRRTSLIAVALSAVLLLAACTAPPSVVVKGTSVAVALNETFTSYNPKTSYGNDATNGAVSYATNSQFAYYDSTPALEQDTSFGSYQVVSQSPFVVKYTIAKGVTWSDGRPVDAADLLLSWAANSGSLNTKNFDATKYTDDSGKFTTPFPAGVVHFDGFSGDGLQLVTKTPVIGDDDRSLTLSYDSYFPDWRLVFGVGLPAHIVAGRALGIHDPQKAENALVKAVQSDDTARLAKVADFWNTGFNFTTTPKDTGLLVSDGPYTIRDISADHLTLVANPRYAGAHRPQFARVVLRFIADPLAQVQALRAGSVDVISPQPSTDIEKQLGAIDGVKVTSGFDGAWEHLDLQFSHSRNGTFDSALVRKAFLEVVPRQQILKQLVSPLEKGATLRSSQLFLPGQTGYAAAVKSNGSALYAKVDVAGAKALLVKAGVSAPQVCILFDPSNPRRVAEFSAIQKSAAQAGFAVTDCSSPDWRDLLGTPGAYDASLYALQPSTLAVSSVAASFRSDSTIDNDNFYSSPEVDSLIDTLDATSDPAAQQAIMLKIDARLWADAYGVTLYQFPAITAVDRGVKGVARSPLAPGLLWNIWAWSPVVKAK
jgi:peptide/nickel transport system substrate-binding protein